MPSDFAPCSSSYRLWCLGQAGRTSDHSQVKIPTVGTAEVIGTPTSRKRVPQTMAHHAPLQNDQKGHKTQSAGWNKLCSQKKNTPSKTSICSVHTFPWPAGPSQWPAQGSELQYSSWNAAEDPLPWSGGTDRPVGCLGVTWHTHKQYKEVTCVSRTRGGFLLIRKKNLEPSESSAPVFHRGEYVRPRALIGQAWRGLAGWTMAAYPII